MSETEPIQLPLAVKAGGQAQHNDGVIRRGGIAFNREELSQILNVYGRKVASGEWRDYAIDTLAREGGVLRVPAHDRSAALPYRESAEAVAPSGRLQRDRGDRADPEARP